MDTKEHLEPGKPAEKKRFPGEEDRRDHRSNTQTIEDLFKRLPQFSSDVSDKIIQLARGDYHFASILTHALGHIYDERLTLKEVPEFDIKLFPEKIRDDVKKFLLAALEYYSGVNADITGDLKPILE